MNYPKMSCEESRKSKFCKAEKDKAKKLRRDGYTLNEIAKKLGMSETTVRTSTDPNARAKNNAKALEINNKRYHNDKKFRDSLRQSIKENTKKRYANDPKFRKYVSLYGRKWYQKNQKKVLKQSKAQRKKIMNNPVLKAKYRQRRNEMYDKMRTERPEDYQKMLKRQEKWRKKAYKDPVKRAKMIEHAKNYAKANKEKLSKLQKKRWKELKKNPKKMAHAKALNKIAQKRYREKLKRLKNAN